MVELTQEEEQKIIDTYNSRRMAALGRIRTPKKLKACMKSIKLAQQARWGRPVGKKKRKNARNKNTSLHRQS